MWETTPHPGRLAPSLPVGQLIVRLDSQPIVHAPLRMLAVVHVAHGKVACAHRTTRLGFTFGLHEPGKESGWQGWGFHDWRSPALHECGACHLAALLRGACTGTERIKRRKTESSRSLRAALLPAERTPRRPLKVSASHTLLFQSVSGALRVLTRPPCPVCVFGV